MSVWDSRIGSTHRSSEVTIVDPSLKRPSLVKSPVPFPFPLAAGGAICGTAVRGCQGATRAHQPMVEGKTALQDALQTTIATQDDPRVHPRFITSRHSSVSGLLVREVPHPSLRALRGVPWLAGARCGIRKVGGAIWATALDESQGSTRAHRPSDHCKPSRKKPVLCLVRLIWSFFYAAFSVRRPWSLLRSEER